MKALFFALIGLVILAGVFMVMKPQRQHPAFLLKQQAELSMIQQFNAWKTKYGVHYSNSENENLRLLIFAENVNYIKSENSKKNTYTLGENQFMDITNEEFVNTYAGKLRFVGNNEVSSEDYTIPNDSFNWNDKGAVTPVKNQAACGSCWAFSVTGVVEGYWFINKGSLPSLSEQQLVDCAGSYGNYGCNGGWPASALEYVRDKGLVTESDYPYVARDQKCKIDSGSYKINSVVATQSVNCDQLVADIKIQPTSVAVDATNWQFYSSGVFSNCAKNINHGVLAIGYTDAGDWVIKNSWGTTWGEKGFITLKSGNTCDVCHYLSNAK